MLFCEFQSKLKKLNSNLRIDCEHEIAPYHPHFSFGGLYDGTQYIMGVPHGEVHEYSLIGVDTKRLEDFGYSCGSLKKGDFIDFSFVEEARKESRGAYEERELSRGYKEILCALIAHGKINRAKAERVFRCSLAKNEKQFPRRYINLGFN